MTSKPSVMDGVHIGTYADLHAPSDIDGAEFYAYDHENVVLIKLHNKSISAAGYHKLMQKADSVAVSRRLRPPITVYIR